MSPPTSSVSSAVNAQGFHFTCTSNVVAEHWPFGENCTLHLLHVLPPDVYADPYELAQRPGFSSSLRGTSDLELPGAAVAAEASVLLLDVDAPPDISRGQIELTVDVPLHLRYADPARHSQSEYHSISLPFPVGFWTCPSFGAGHVLPPQLAQHLSSDAYPSSRVSLVTRASPAEFMSITVPAGRLGDLAVVDVGTASVMLLMLGYLAIISSKSARRLHARTSKQE